jgi:type I restriction enzyme, S subunit
MTSVEGWKTQALSAVAKIVMGQSPDSQYYSEEETGFPFLQGCAEFTNKYPSAKLYCSQLKKVAVSESILFSVRAPVGRTNRANQDYIIGRGLAALSAFEISQDYLHYYLINIENDFRNASQGSTFEAINSKELSNWNINFPELFEEQTQIATILSTIDHAIEQTEALIAKQQRIKTGLMQDLLTKGIDENGNIRSEETHEFKDSPLGRIPVEWEINTFGNLVREYGGKIQTGPFGSQLHAHEYTNEGIPVVMPQDITDSGISVLNIARITDTKANDLRRHKMSPEDIVFARRGDLSRCAFISQEQSGWICGTGCLLFGLPTNILSPMWATQIYKNHSTQLQVGVQAVGSTMVNLNTNILSNLKIPLPKIAEQIKIEERFYEIENDLKNLFHIKQKMNLIKSALMQDLLTGKVRVTDLLNQPQTST